MCLWYFTRAPIVLHANENRKWKSRKDREIIFSDQKFLYFFRRWYKIESVLFWISEIRDKFDRGYIKIFLIVNVQIFNEKVEHSKVCRLLHCLMVFFSDWSYHAWFYLIMCHVSGFLLISYGLHFHGMIFHSDIFLRLRISYWTFCLKRKRI